MRIALAQINTTLGDFLGNSEKIISKIHKAVSDGAELIVFPEATLFGYHPFDLLERKSLVIKQMQFLKKVHQQVPPGVGVLVGLFTLNKSKKGRPYFNSAALLVHGKSPQFFHKTLLPTGDVFDEARFIELGDMNKNFFSFKNKKFLLTICEDIWAWPYRGVSSYKVNPLEKLKKKKIEAVINMSASPYFVEKMKLRMRVTTQTARHFNVPLIYVNMVGAQDEIIFDGASFVVDSKGHKKLSCLKFQEDLNFFDLKSKKADRFEPESDSISELWTALVLGIRDFCRKVEISKVHLGLSGGIDSALVAALAVQAIGADNVVGLALPGPFSSAESLQTSKNLAKNLKIKLHEISIGSLYQQSVDLFLQKLQHKEFNIVNENLQARIRGLILMAYANKEGSLLLSTSNKSEYAVGYATLYGDMCGGLAPLGDLTKEQVYQLAQFCNEKSEVIPKFIIDRPPSAELRPNQKDEDSLPPYSVLDKSVKNIVELCLAPADETEKWLTRLLYKSEFKRWQAPPILKVSAHSFGRGRRYPVAHKATETE